MVRNEIVACLKEGGIGVIPTDTIYGLVGSALQPKTIERIYRVRKRERNKPFIVLIASAEELGKFGIHPSPRIAALLKTLWPRPSVTPRGGGPGPVTVILPCESKRFAYLHPGSDGISFRVPGPAWLRAVLKKTGPLVAPSANIAGESPAKTTREAYAYFKGSVDFYIDRGTLGGEPSSLLKLLR